MGRQSNNRPPLHIDTRIESWGDGNKSIRHPDASYARYLSSDVSPAVPQFQGRPINMADEISGESITELPIVSSERLLNRVFLRTTILENIEEVAELLRPVLRKSAGLKAMTVEERRICEFFIDEVGVDEDVDL